MPISGGFRSPFGKLPVANVRINGSEQETVKGYPLIEFALEASVCGCSETPELVSWESMIAG